MADMQRLPRWLPILNQVGSVDMVEMRLMWRCNVVVVILNLVQNLSRMRCEPMCISNIALPLT